MPSRKRSGASQPVIAVCDACVLYPFHLRNLLVQVSVDGLYEARWTDDIHDEWIGNLLIDRPTIPLERLRHTKALMEAALPGARVEGFRHHVQDLTLPDADDRHVVAAAIEAGASRLVTWNVRDFPEDALKEYRLKAQTPDTFLVELYDRMPGALVASLAHARRNLSRSSLSVDDFLIMLRDQKLVDLCERLRDHAGAP